MGNSFGGYGGKGGKGGGYGGFGGKGFYGGFGGKGGKGGYYGGSIDCEIVCDQPKHKPQKEPKCDSSAYCKYNCCPHKPVYQPPQQLRCYEDCFFSGGSGGKGGKGGKGGYYGSFQQCTIFCEGDIGWDNMYWNYENYSFGYGRDKNYWGNTGGYIGGGSSAGYYSSGSNNNHKYNPMPAYQPPKCDPS